MARGLLAFALLTASGFVTGFTLTNGSGRYLGMLPEKHGAVASHANEQAAAGIMAAGGGGGGSGRRAAGGGAGGADGGDTDDDAEAGGDAPSSAAGGSAAGGAAGGAGQTAGGPGDGAAAKAKPGSAEGLRAAGRAQSSGEQRPDPRMLTGEQAAAFLAGNTVVEDATPGREWYSYFESAGATMGSGDAGLIRGARMTGDRRAFTAKLWDPRKPRLCDPGEDGILVCRTVEVRAAMLGAAAPGAEIGQIRKVGERWLPILSGNVAKFPEHLPGLQTTLGDAPTERIVKTPTATGKAALSALIERAAAVAPSEGEASRLMLFTRDGRVYDIEQPRGAVDDVAGLSVKVGTWTLVGDRLCRPLGDAAARSCFAIEALGATTFRLVPDGKRTVLRLAILPERPRAEQHAAE